MEKITNLKFNIVGVTFDNEDGSSRQQMISEMQKSSTVVLMREPSNRFDRNAIAVYKANVGELGFSQIGYIGKQYAAVLAPMMDQGKKFNASVDEVGFYEKTHYCKIVVNEE